MAFLCVLSFLTYFDRVCIVRAQIDIQNDLHLSDVAMGWILGASWFAYAVFEIPSGFLGDRYGARGTLTRIVIAWSIFTALSRCPVAFWPWFRDNPAHKRSVHAAELALIQSGRAQADQAASHARIPGLFRALISSPSLWALAILYTCVSFGWSFFVSWVPRFFKDVHH